MELVFVTGNEGKRREVQGRLPDWVDVLSLKDIGWQEDIEETEPTIAGNAILKARTVHQVTGRACFADDTGLCVDALSGAPGVYSARYAGPQVDAERNMEKLLSELAGIEDRSAHFETSIALILEDEVFVFKGIIEGRIAYERNGDGGFGYDPIFVPNGHDRSFAQFSTEEKGAISHRGKALQKMADFLDRLKV